MSLQVTTHTCVGVLVATRARTVSSWPVLTQVVLPRYHAERMERVLTQLQEYTVCVTGGIQADVVINSSTTV